MSVTAYTPFRDGNGKILEVREWETERSRRNAKIKDLRTYFAAYYTFGTFESPELRVDWVTDQFGVSMWWAEISTPVHTGPESLGTIWACQDCMLHHANGECGGCHEGHDEEPLSRIGEGFHVAMGMAWNEHSCGREVATQDTPVPEDTPLECDCETNTFSTSQCEGCGSYLHGERHAMTLFKV